MRILYLITKSGIGGAQTHLYQLSEYMLGRKHQVAVMSDPGGWLEGKVKDMGGTFYPNPFFSITPNPFKWIQAYRLVKKAVNDFAPDIVSCHGSLAGMVGRLAVRNKIPTIFTVHGWGFTPGTPLIRRQCVLLAERMTGRYARKIICVSEYDKNLTLRYRIVPTQKLITLHNGIDLSARDRFRRSQRVSDRIIITFVGRLAPPKDPLLLVQSFFQLSSSIKERAKIYIIGDGVLREEVEKFIQASGIRDMVHLIGGVSQQEVFECLKRSDIFILLSNWEGLPYSILEAMSFGLPVIATDVGGVREAVTQECGILVKRNDIKGVTKALENLIVNEGLRKRMGEEARRYVEQHFSLQEMCKKTEAVYRSVV